ncbi:MAG: hypothetical protein MJE12_22940 [Alphaproteobacteria bacterium]|nr:hypothetical protein [Alphaproteobacteria bacterium]
MRGKFKGSIARRFSGRRRRETICVAVAGMLFIAALAIGFFLHRGETFAKGTVQTAMGAVTTAMTAETPVQYLDLPPIVARLHVDTRQRSRIVTVSATLEFAADSERTAIHYVRTAKIMLPFIMDSIATGMQRLNPAVAHDSNVVSNFVLKRSNRVLQPHGVQATGLRVDDLRVK